MKGFRFIYTFLVLTIFFLSCASGNDVTSPGLERVSQLFEKATEIFGPSTSGNFPAFFHDISLGTIQSIPYWQEPTSPTECAAVTLNRQDNTPYEFFKPVYRWLDTDPYGPGADPEFATNWDESSIWDLDYRAPSCKAAIIDGQLLGLQDEPFNQLFLELVICYQVKGIGASGHDTDWDIGISVLHWYDDENTPEFNELENFSSIPPLHRLDLLLSGSTLDDEDEYNPDIAYDPDNGDLYLVYSQVLPNKVDVRLRYRRFDRATGSITGAFGAQTDTHNAYDPSIDVGIVSTAAPENCVVVAYTAQFKEYAGITHYGYHVCATVWPVSAGDEQHDTTHDLMNQDYMYNNAGLPCVDIAPNTNAKHVICLTYTQVVGTDGFGPVTKVIAVQAVRGDTSDPEHTGWVMTELEIDPIGGDPERIEYDDGMYSSICIEYEDNFLMPSLASVTFMAQDYNTDILRPRAAHIYVATDHGDDPTQLWNDWVDYPSTITGNYNISEIPFINPGISTAIVAQEDHYWAAWCDRIELEPPPQAVFASYGSAGPF